MAMSTKVGSFSSNTATGNQAITGLGFKPQVILFWGYNVNAFSTNGGTNATRFYGAAVSSASRFSIAYTDANGTNAGYQTNAKCFVVIGAGSSTVLAAADFVTMDSDGFTVNITTGGTAYLINYMAIGGTDLSNAAIEQITAPASTGSQATTGVGFKPDCILTFTNSSASALPATLAEGDIGFGWGIDSANRFALSFAPSKGHMQNTKVIFSENNGGTTQLSADLTSLDSDGFTLNFATTISGAFIWVICLKGGKYAVGSFTQKTSTGIQAITGLGFKPSGLLLQTEDVTTFNSANRNSTNTFGAGSSPTSRGDIWLGDDNFATSDSWSLGTKIIGNYDNGSTPTVLSEADLSSFDSGGFSLNWSTADATARQHIYFAIGGTPVYPFRINHLRPRIFAPGIAR